MDILKEMMKLDNENNLNSLREEVMELSQDLCKKGLAKDILTYEISDTADQKIAEYCEAKNINYYLLPKSEMDLLFDKVYLLVTRQMYQKVLNEA